LFPAVDYKNEVDTKQLKKNLELMKKSALYKFVPSDNQGSIDMAAKAVKNIMSHRPQVYCASSDGSSTQFSIDLRLRLAVLCQFKDPTNSGESPWRVFILGFTLRLVT
jgi:hypothetical protein